MKILLTWVLGCLSLPSFCQIKSYSKNYSDTSGKYLIKYSYALLSGKYMHMKIHYESKIAVYKISGDTTLVGEVFHGVYVKENCIDDNPASHVKKAKTLKDNK